MAQPPECEERKRVLIVRTLELLIRPHPSEPQRALSAVERFLEQEQIEADILTHLLEQLDQIAAAIMHRLGSPDAQLVMRTKINADELVFELHPQAAELAHAELDSILAEQTDAETKAAAGFDRAEVVCEADSAGIQLLRLIVPSR